MSSREDKPQDIGGYVEQLASTFINDYDARSTLNPVRFLRTKCIAACDTFMDDLSQLGGQKKVDKNTFTASQLGDEIVPESKTTESKTTESTSVSKKRRLNDGTSTSGHLDSDDVSMDSESDDIPKDKKRKRAKRRKLPEKFKNDEDLQSLEAPPEVPCSASEFFDPISHCQISLERESRLTLHLKREQIGGDDVDIESEHIRFIERERIEQYVKRTANSNGKTVQKDVGTMICLGLQDHLRNMMDEMEQWRQKRLDLYGKHQRRKVFVQNSGIDAQQWMDAVNEQYAEKQQIVEAQDELLALMDEQTDLKMQKLTGILSAEEENRLKRLPDLIRETKAKQAKSAQNRDAINVSAMKAVGGDFTFGNMKNAKRRVKELRDDKFYVIDVVNMLGQHRNMNQQHLKQLSTLLLKQTS